MTDAGVALVEDVAWASAGGVARAEGRPRRVNRARKDKRRDRTPGMVGSQSEKTPHGVSLCPLVQGEWADAWEAAGSGG